MAYYGGRGDFYRGQGDPGLFDFLKKGIGAITGGIPVIGPAVKIGGAIIQHARGKALEARARHPERYHTTADLEYQARRGGTIPMPFDESGRGRKGRYRMRMSPSGVPVGVPEFGPASTGRFGFRRRHMNVANVKALHRAVRRLLGFKKLATKVENSLMKLARRHHYRAPAPPPRRRLPRGRGDMMLGDFYQGDG